MFKVLTRINPELVMVLGLGLFLAWLQAEGALAYPLIVASRSPVAWLFACVGSFLISRRIAWWPRGRKTRYFLATTLSVLGGLTAYLCWAQYRTIYSVMELEKPFPYPDPAILALEHWFDVRRPIPRGTLKLHGEFPMVALTLGFSILVLGSVSGFLLGTLLNPRHVTSADRADPDP